MISLGVIPARGGSKSVPLKNIKELCDKPLIAYTIESAKRSKLLSRMVVSTDNEQIAKVSESYGSEVILRPSELAIDTAPIEWALLHVLKELKKKEGFEPDIVLTLQPTSPFRTATLIDQTIEVFNNPVIDSVIAVVETHDCYGKIIDGRFEYLIPDQPHRRQEREPLYLEASTIYATRTDRLKQKNSIRGDKMYPLMVDKLEAIDMDTPLDFYFAEALMKFKNEKEYLS